MQAGSSRRLLLCFRIAAVAPLLVACGCDDRGPCSPHAGVGDALEIEIIEPYDDRSRFTWVADLGLFQDEDGKPIACTFDADLPTGTRFIIDVRKQIEGGGGNCDRNTGCIRELASTVTNLLDCDTEEVFHLPASGSLVNVQHAIELSGGCRATWEMNVMARDDVVPFGDPITGEPPRAVVVRELTAQLDSPACDSTRENGLVVGNSVIHRCAFVAKANKL